MTPIAKDAQKRERIIAAAMEVFAAEGLSKGTIASVASRAGIGKGTVYEYFRSKDELFQAMLEYFFAGMIAQWEALIQSPLAYKDKLNLLIDSTFDFMDFDNLQAMSTWRMVFEIILYALRQPEGGESAINLAESFRSLISAFEPLLAEGVERGLIKPMETRDLAFLLFAALDGVGLHFFLQKGNYDAGRLKSLLRQILVTGIFKEAL
ncbi:MAG TPA: TetR/AcrR family transcriptional regulator [Candidatus Marinimicrobia bacterium]|nr:TetR/AcrR family transcriptional regulator [Candidatus Neomarinimicrobiota bacterium]